MISTVKCAGELIRAQTLRVDLGAHSVDGRLMHAQQHPTPSVEVSPVGIPHPRYGHHSARPMSNSTAPSNGGGWIVVSSNLEGSTQHVLPHCTTRQRPQRTIPRWRVRRCGAKSDASDAATYQNGTGTWAYGTGDVR